MIDIIDIAGTESNSILLENAYNVTLAKVSGIIEGSDLRIAARADEFENSRDITIQNFTLKIATSMRIPAAKTSFSETLNLKVVHVKISAVKSLMIRYHQIVSHRPPVNAEQSSMQKYPVRHF